MVYTRPEVIEMKKKIILMFLLVTTIAFGGTTYLTKSGALLFRMSTSWVR